MLDALAKLSARRAARCNTTSRTRCSSAPRAGPDASRAWAASTYTQLGLGLRPRGSRAGRARGEENHALQASLAESAGETQRAMLLLIVTMLAGSVAADLHLRRPRKQRRARSCAVARALRPQRRALSRPVRHASGADVHLRSRDAALSRGQRGRDRSNTATRESEFLGMTIRAIRPNGEIARLESHSAAQRRRPSRAAPWRACGITGARTARRSAPTFRITR